MQSIESLLQSIFKSENAKIESRLLGGMMNETYIVSFSNKKYVLYIPQGNANEIVNRNEEKFVQKIASDLGVTSKNVYFDTASGIKCHEFIEGESLNKVDDFAYEKIANLLKTFHSSKALSHYSYCPFEKLQEYYNQVSSFMRLGEDFEKLYNALCSNRKYLENQKMVLSHNDFQKSNIIKTINDEYKIIDFEFVANNDPIYDIAAFGNNDVKEGRMLLDSYFNGSPSDDEINRYYLWRVFISLQWYLMALIKDNNGEGKVHNFNFKIVAEHFLNNAKEAYEGLR